MNSSHALSAPQEQAWYFRPALRRSYIRADRPRALQHALKVAAAEDEREQGDRHDAVDGRTPHARLEHATKTFRWLRARRYRSLAAEARASYRVSVENFLRYDELRAFARVMSPELASKLDSTRVRLEQAEVLRKLTSRARWYEGRAAGQGARFENVRACSKRSLKVTCRLCAEALVLDLPCRCGVVRTCDGCAEAVAKKRQKRIADARIAVIQRGHQRGLFLRKRAGGRFTEKMLTVTVPHFLLEDATGLVAEECAEENFGLHTTVNARVVALRLAWPRFYRKVKRWLAGFGKRGERRSPRCNKADAKLIESYRSLEWTRGHDGLGHPHLHVYLFAPWLPLKTGLLERWWARALESVGVPLPTSCARCSDPNEPHRCAFGRGNGHAILQLMALEGFSWATLRELIKSGNRRAIEMRMGNLEATSGGRAIQYSMGWTMSKGFEDLEDQLLDAATLDVQRDLFCALEGRRMAQGSRGFLAPPRRPECLCCGQSVFAASVADLCEVGKLVDASLTFVHSGASPPNAYGSN